MNREVPSLPKARNNSLTSLSPHHSPIGVPIAMLKNMKVGNPKEWTVLCYLNGHGNQQSEVDRSVRDLERVGSTDSVDLVTQVAGGEPYYGNYGSHIQKSKLLGMVPTSRSIPSPQESDPASPSRLAESIIQTAEAYPSKHLMVVMGGHGGAFQGLMPNSQTGERMRLEGLKTALNAAKEALGRPIDMLVMDSCLMGSVETAHAVKDSVRYLAASEEIVLSNNLRYDKLAKGLQGADTEGAIEAVMEARNNKSLSTASVVDCSRMDELVSRMKPFAMSVDTAADAQHFRQPKVLKRVGSPDRPSTLSDMRDLSDLAGRAGDAELARFVKGEVVVRHAHGEGQGLDDSHGLSIYAPSGEPVESYRESGFAQETGWLINTAHPQRT